MSMPTSPAHWTAVIRAAPIRTIGGVGLQRELLVQNALGQLVLGIEQQSHGVLGL